MEQDILHAASFFEPAFVFYVILSLVASYAFLLFLWWYIKNERHASEVYLYMMGLFAGVVLENLPEAYARSCLIRNDYDRWNDLVNSWMWGWRNALLFIPIALISARMTWRIIKSRRLRNG